MTPENTDSAWLLFEAGALSKALGRSRVCPLLLGMSPSDIDGPLSQFQATTLSREEMFALLVTLNEELKDTKLEDSVLQRMFDRFWPDLEAEVLAIARMRLPSSDLRSVVDALSKHGFPQPSVGRMVCFAEGFESHRIYDLALSEARERIYVFGRKNRKLFDKEHGPEFAELANRIHEGLDFRCLFLDPRASPHILQEEHRDKDFSDQLRRCIENACGLLRESGIDVGSVCRMYNNHRQHALVVIDHAVLFSSIERDTHGTAKTLTKCRFEVVDSGPPLGDELVSGFQSVWDSATPLTELEKQMH